MSFIFKSHDISSPVVESIAQITSTTDKTFMVTPDGSWGILVMKKQGGTHVFLTGVTTKPIPVDMHQGDEITSIAFKPGWYMSHASIGADKAEVLTRASGGHFRLGSATLEVPVYENADTFVEKLLCEKWIQKNEAVVGALEGNPKAMSPRTLQRHFLQTTGLTQSYLQQIYRAQAAASLLKSGKPLPQVAHEAGYADQSHMTRWLKHMIGQTPRDIAKHTSAS